MFIAGALTLSGDRAQEASTVSRFDFWFSLFEIALPDLRDPEFWKNAGPLLFKRLFALFSDGCETIRSNHNKIIQLNRHTPGLAHINTLNAMAFHAGMTGVEALLEPGAEASMDPAWSLLTMTSSHELWSSLSANAIIPSDEAYSLFQNEVLQTRLQSEDHLIRKYQPLNHRINQVHVALSQWPELTWPVWEQGRELIFGKNQQIFASIDELGSYLSELLSSDSSAKYDFFVLSVYHHLQVGLLTTDDHIKTVVEHVTEVSSASTLDVLLLRILNTKTQLQGPLDIYRELVLSNALSGSEVENAYAFGTALSHFDNVLSSLSRHLPEDAEP